MLENGKKLQDRYKVEKQIGQGGMGSVYLATDERFNSIVAIKETLFADDNYRKAFSREARLLNSLKHTALPKVSDTFIDGNGQYIVMEYISGEDLFEMLETSGEAFPIEDVLIWAEQLLDALEYLHGQKNPVIHRDIKPQNLKLTPQGQVILLDFGLAKGNPTDANHHTAANSIFGYSRNYASLEQIQGTGTDPRSDIYSLAATLYHLLTGKPPADALTRVMMVLNEEDDPLQPANLIHEQVSEELADNLQKAMSLNANLRPQTAAEMRELLSGKQKVTVSTKPNTSPNRAAETNFHTQNTKVLDELESANNSRQADIKTEVLPLTAIPSDSIKTKVAKPVTLNDNNQDTQNSAVQTKNVSNNNLIFAAAAVILLFVGSVASMVYFFSPSSTASNVNAFIESNNAIAETNESENSELDSNSNADTDDAELAESENDSDNSFPLQDLENSSVDNEPLLSDKKATKNNETGFAKEATKSLGRNSEPKVDQGEALILKDGTVKTKNAKIADGRVETDSVVIDDKGIRLKNNTGTKSKLPPNAPVTAEEFKNLSPEQKKKVQEALLLQKRLEERQKRIEQNRKRRYPRRPPPPRPRPRP